MLRKLGWLLLWPSTVHKYKAFPLEEGATKHLSLLKGNYIHDFLLFFLSIGKDGKGLSC